MSTKKKSEDVVTGLQSHLIIIFKILEKSRVNDDTKSNLFLLQLSYTEELNDLNGLGSTYPWTWWGAGLLKEP